MRKKKILLCNESSMLSTGYSTYGYEVLTRLFNTEKYELAELAAYGSPEDLNSTNIPWKYFPVLPPKNRPDLRAKYESKATNKFGEFIFDEVCAIFKPDIVWDIRDYWMFEFEERSPARPYYHWVVMPTVDSAPQHDDWISTFMNADGVFTYSDWGLDILRKQSNNRIKTQCSAPPGANLRDYKCLNKSDVRKKIGIPDDALIIGTVMRNQLRKLYPDLMESFAKFLQEAPPEIASKAYLYIHCCYPDVGWDIPRLLIEHGIGSRTYFTYQCVKCKNIYPSRFQDGRAPCKFCGEHSAFLPDIKTGVPSTILNEIMAMFDVYVQYAVCLPPEEKVFVNGDWMHIKDVKVGDIAFTHNGRWMPVTEKMENDYEGQIHEISVCGDYAKTKFTGEHPLFGLFKENIECIKNTGVRETIGHKIRNNQELPIPQFLEVSKVQTGDLIGYVIDDSVQDIVEKEGIIIDDEFCKFIGLFAADGTVNKDCGQIRVCSNIVETQNQNLSESIFKRFNSFSENKYIDRNAIDSICCSTNIRNIFINWFGKHDYKQIPDWTSNLPIAKQKLIIQGLMMGDGCYVENINTTVYVTISEKLASQLKNLLRRCRINFNVRLVDKEGNRKPQYRFEIVGNGKIGNFECNSRKSTSNIYISNIHYMKVKTVKTENYTGKVYNFAVKDDNSYCCLIGHSHNCEGFGMPQVEAAASGTPIMAVDYSAMSDVVRKLKGTPLKVQRLFRDIHTESYRALPDNDFLVKSLIDFFKQPKEKRLEQGVIASNEVAKHYTWEKTTKIWENYFDSVIPLDKWNEPARISEPDLNVPSNLSDTEFVNWAFSKIGNRPDLINSYLATKLTRDLGLGVCVNGLPNVLADPEYSNESFGTYGSFTREALASRLVNLCQMKNIFEKRREL